MTGEESLSGVWTMPWRLAGAQPSAGEVVVRLVEALPAGGEVQVKLREAEVAWSPGTGWVVATFSAAEALLPGLAEFARIEEEMRDLEREIEAAWPGLEEDRGAIFDATVADLRRSAILGDRVGATFARRIRLARLQSLMTAHGRRLLPAAERLVQKMLEASEAEARVELLEGQCEIFEHIYEMVSQRVGEYRASRQTERVEWIIIGLLAAELAIMLVRRG